MATEWPADILLDLWEDLDKMDKQIEAFEGMYRLAVRADTPLTVVTTLQGLTSHARDRLKQLGPHLPKLRAERAKV